MMLWLTHFFPAEDWAVAQRRRSLAVLDLMWREDGYFCREPNLPQVSSPSPITVFRLVCNLRKR